MQTIAEIKAAATKLERTIIYLETRSFAALLTEEQQAELETAKKELDILEKKERLEELRKELQNGQLSYGELAELQSLSEYIDKGDVELLEAAGVLEFPEELSSVDINRKRERVIDYFIQNDEDDYLLEKMGFTGNELEYLYGGVLKDRNKNYDYIFGKISAGLTDNDITAYFDDLKLDETN